MKLLHDEAPPAPPAVADPMLIDTFWNRVDTLPGNPALREHRGGAWQSVSWADYGLAVTEAAAGLVALGIETGDRVAVLASNQVRWHEADVAILASGAVSVPLYPTSASGQLAYVLEHSGSRICFVGDRDQLAKVLLRRHALGRLEHAVLFAEPPDGLDDPFVLTFDDLRSLGRDRLADDPDLVRRRSAAIEPDSLATIVYTSGTTGPPKGAMLSYANLGATIRSITELVPIGPGDRFLSYLPLSHIAERVVSHFGQIASGGETWFARSLATVAEDLVACRPTIFFAVPRVWERFKQAILDGVAASPRPARDVAEAYLRAAARMAAAAKAGVRQSLQERLAYLALDRTVGANLRRRTGLDRSRIRVSAAAPVDSDLLWWFTGIGLPIVEVYGQTEDCGPTTMNPPHAIRVGSVGLPMPGLEVRIGADGEVLVRGATVTRGYFADEARSKELIDDEGWMHSGDLGHIDDDGYVYVTGRKKDLIITSSGKNIAPQDLETRLGAEPLISQAVVIGNDRPYLTALIALEAEAVTRWAHSKGKLGDLETLLNDPELHEEIEQVVARHNRDRSPIERIKRWRFIPKELTVTAGELTPTLKVKRDVVSARFQDLIDEMYASAG